MRAVQIVVFGISTLSIFAQVAPTEANLRAAALSGGLTKFSGSGIINLSTHVVFSTDTTLDADGHTVVIDGQKLTRLLEVHSTAHLTLKGITLANGLFQGADYNITGGAGESVAGAAIRNLGGSVTTYGCVFSNNAAAGGSGYNPSTSFGLAKNGGSASGGAIFQTDGSLTIHGGAFLNNAANAGAGSGPARAFGGAICALAGTVLIDGGARFETNQAIAGSHNGLTANAEAHGGAVYLEGGDLQAVGAQFFANRAHGNANASAFGGAVASKNGTVTMSDAFFRGNTVSGGRGSFYTSAGIFGMPGTPAFGGAMNIGSNANAIVRTSTFESNSATGGAKQYQSFQKHGDSFGGAISVAGTATVVNSTFVDNGLFTGSNLGDSPPVGDPAVQLGGAIYNSGSLEVTFSTIGKNSSTGPILASGSGTFTLKNSLLDQSSSANVSPEVIDGGHNLSATGTPAFTQSTSHNNVDLKLGPLGDYGGPTPTLPLMLGSPAIDAAGDGPIPLTDQRGRARPYGTKADLGAFESSAPFYIFGKLNGYRNDSTTITFNQTSVTPDADGLFKFVVPAGSNTFSFAGTNSVFRPNPLVIQVNAEMETETRAFAFQTLAFDPDLSSPAFTLAGIAGETWELQMSSDLTQWTPVQTNTFASDGLTSVLLTNSPTAVFLKAIHK